MKKFIRDIILFSTIIAMIFIGANVFQNTFNNDIGHYQMQYDDVLNTDTEFEGIIIGTSHATHSIRPSVLDQTGVQFQNFALNGANSQFYIDWWNNIFSKFHIPPKYCLLSVDNYFLTKNAWRTLESDAEYLNHEVFFNLLVKEGINRKVLLGNRLPAIKYRSSIIESLSLNKGDAEYLINTYDRGYVTFEPEEKFKGGERPVKPNFISEHQQSNFLELLKLLKNNNVETIFIMPPEYDIKKDEYVFLDNFISAVSELTDIPYLNFNDEFYLPEYSKVSNFSDFFHMNGKGSKIFSNELKNAISPFILPADSIQ